MNQKGNSNKTKTIGTALSRAFIMVTVTVINVFSGNKKRRG